MNLEPGSGKLTFPVYNIGNEELNEKLFSKLEEKIDSEGGVRLIGFSNESSDPLAIKVGRRFSEGKKYVILPGGKGAVIIEKYKFV